VCSSQAVRHRLLACGVAAPRAVVIPPLVERGTAQAARRSEVRAQLNLGADDDVVLALPPVARSTGALTAAWAVLLLEKVRPTVRVVVPGAGREVERIVRLAEACHHEWVLRLAPSDLPLSALLAAADVAAYLPAADVPLGGPLAAALRGCPLVATAVPSLREWLAEENAVGWCRPGDPEDAARQLLQALAHREQTHLRAERARMAATSACDFEKGLASYRRVYANLAQRRPAGA
jgi:glycosyltransferase involved in cell wall biosynthesis